MSDIPDDDEIKDHDVFDTAGTKVDYMRTKDLKTVHVKFFNDKGIGELKLYLLLCLEIEKLEKRLGISEIQDGKH